MSNYQGLKEFTPWGRWFGRGLRVDGRRREGGVDCLPGGVGVWLWRTTYKYMHYITYQDTYSTGPMGPSAHPLICTWKLACRFHNHHVRPATSSTTLATSCDKISSDILQRPAIPFNVPRACNNNLLFYPVCCCLLYTPSPSLGLATVQATVCYSFVVFLLHLIEPHLID